MKPTLMFQTHPSDAELLALAHNDSDANADTQRTVKSHLETCQRCRNTVQDVRGLKQAAQSEWTPPASAALLARIQSSRARGAEVILADVNENVGSAVDITAERSFNVSRWTVGFALASAAVFTAIVVSKPTPRSATVVASHVSTKSTDADSTDMQFPFDAANAFASALSPLPSLLQAQNAPLRASGPIYSGIDGSKLTPAQWTFATTRTIDDSISGVLNVQSVSLERATFNKRPVWRMVSTSVGRSPGVDTMLLEPFDLRPIQRHWHVGRFTIQDEYGRQGAELLNVVRAKAASDASSPAKVDTIRLLINPKGLLIDSDAQLQLLFKLMPLQRGWQITHGAREYRKPGTNGVLPTRSRTLRVVGDTIIRTPFKNTPAWRVTYDDQSLWTWFVSKENGDIVRIAGSWQHTTTRFQTDRL